MLKRFDIVAHLQNWDVRHNEVSVETFRRKGEAIRVALTLVRMQQRMGDEAEVILRDASGRAMATRRYSGALASGMAAGRTRTPQAERDGHIGIAS